MNNAEFTRFAQALIDADAPVPNNVRVVSGAARAERFAVYRNNVHTSLIDALADRFPVTQTAVGEEFFRAMVRVYVQDHKPTQAALLSYGDTLPAFIELFAPADSVPWLADMARVEAAWTQSWAAADDPALTLADLQHLPPERLLGTRVQLHGAARLIRSNHPIASLWQAHQDAPADLSRIHQQAEALLITRPQTEVLLRALPAAAAQLATSLAQGLSVEEAAQTALQITPDFDLGNSLAGLILDGFISQLDLQD
jgi:hypothetical protein